jgi:hypothetical protein
VDVGRHGHPGSRLRVAGRIALQTVACASAGVFRHRIASAPVVGSRRFLMWPTGPTFHNFERGFPAQPTSVHKPTTAKMWTPVQMALASRHLYVLAGMGTSGGPKAFPDGFARMGMRWAKALRRQSRALSTTPGSGIAGWQRGHHRAWSDAFFVQSAVTRRCVTVGVWLGCCSRFERERSTRKPSEAALEGDRQGLFRAQATRESRHGRRPRAALFLSRVSGGIRRRRSQLSDGRAGCGFAGACTAHARPARHRATGRSGSRR